MIRERRRVQTLFAEALERPESERAGFVAKVGESHPELARELESLLEHDGGEDAYPFPSLVQPTGAPEPGEVDHPPPSASIGGYRLIRRIGTGGMGVVYEAEQEQLGRRVALKVVRGGHLADDLKLRLFQREVAALARLDHPGIATIIEAGRGDDGLPYFVMELVRGETLDVYDERLRSERGDSATALALRLRLFVRVAEAVHYAHQRGVLHRDLKPSNILVAAPDETPQARWSESNVPRVKILDFGVARIVSGEDDGSLTRAGDVRGTLRFLSPEQARGDPNATDVRSDVYSLGVVLYLLSTGSLPYEVQSLPLPEALRVVCEQPPKRPSDVAAHPVPRDLEAILLKALEKDPDRRYASAHAFREDVERFLSHEPVEARAPSTLYRHQMLVSRHRTVFAALATVMVLLAAFAVAMGVAERRTSRERDRANREAAAAGATTDFLVGLFELSDPEQTSSDTMTVRGVLERGTARIRDELSEQPYAQARLLKALGTAQKHLGRNEEALPLFEEALAVYERVGAPDSLIADGWNDVGMMRLREGDAEAALSAHERAVALWERSLPGDHPLLGGGLNTLGNALSRLNRLDEAEPFYQRALAIRVATHGETHRDVASTLANLGGLERRRGNYAAALAYHERAHRVFLAALGPEHPQVARALRSAAMDLIGLAEHARAVERLEQALAIQERALGTEHPSYAGTLTSLSDALGYLGEFDRAIELQRRSLEINETALGPDHPTVGIVLHQLGAWLRRNGDLTAAREVCNRALAVMEKAYGPDHPSTGAAWSGLAHQARLEGNLPDAEASFRRALDIQERTLGVDHSDAGQTRTELAVVVRDLGRYAEAESLFARASATFSMTLPPDHPFVHTNVTEHAELLRLTGRADSLEVRHRR